MQFVIKIRLFAVITLAILVVTGFTLSSLAQSSEPSDGDSLPVDSSTLATDASPDTTVDPELVNPPRMIVTTQRLLIGDGVLEDTLLVSVQTLGQQMAGFDLKIGIASEYVDIVDVLPGEVSDSCRWEMFDARPSRFAGQDGYPRQLWQAIALAETVPRPNGAICRGLDREASLIRIALSSNPLVPTPDTTVSVFFFWEDCGDNTIADASGSILAMSSQLYDVFPVHDFDGLPGLPTRLGAPRQCIDPASLNKPIRMIEFHNGGIEFRYGADPDSSLIRSVRAELQQMLREDMRSCDLLDSLEAVLDWESDTVQQAYRDQAAMGDKHFARLEEILAEFGWPGQTIFGDEATRAAFIVIQHSDPEHMEKYFPLIKSAAERGELSRSAVAAMEDRILIFRGQPQKFGTQVYPDPATGQLALRPIADEGQVDVRRAGVGLPPLADYLRQFGIDYQPPDSSR